MPKRIRTTMAVLALIGVMASMSLVALKVADCMRPDHSYDGILVVRAAEPSQGQGTCFVVARQDGWWYAVTARHVTETGPITVDDEQYAVEVVQVHPDKDVAVIRFQSPETYTIYSLGEARVGDTCTTIGWSRGSMLIYKGYVVSLDFKGSIVSNGGGVPGCSGGALMNQSNQVVGVLKSAVGYGISSWDSTILYVPSSYAEIMLREALSEDE